MNTKFTVLTEQQLKSVEGGGKATRIGTMTCVDKKGRAVCTPDYDAIRRQTAQVIGNGWINYGPWNPRPGFGVILP
ncbi:bacteriocin [Streptococcus hyovaginalis]|uniref:bacteriocin n=1 Tax=Streptococcus hyovaginalis TaxID=149015 RepID=UPI0014793FCE|nr:bacteriocin [Streptococcus hyovaginalis]